MHKIEDIKATTSINESNLESLIENEQSTALSLKSVCYTWTIDDFYNCLKFHNSQFSSSDFVFQNTKWHLRLCVVTDNVEVKSVKIFLENKSKIDDYLSFRNNVSIVDDDGKVLSQADVEFCATEDNAILPSPVCLVVPWDSESFVLPNKFIVRSEFSSLIPEMSEDTKFSRSNSDSQNVYDPQCGTNGGTSVSPLSNHRIKCSSPLARWIFSSFSDWEVKGFILLCACLSLKLILAFDENIVQNNNQVTDAIHTIRSNEINYLIFDSTKKLNLIAEALNLTSVKEKSEEILALYSEMYNSTDHIEPVMQSIESNKTQSFTSKINAFVASAVRQFILGMNNDSEKSV